MSEEGSVDNVESVEEYRKQQEQTQEPTPWSAPPTIEPSEVESPSYDPLEPLAPARMANAIAGTLTPEVPDVDSLLEGFTQPGVTQVESVVSRVLRPVARVSSDTCPSGFLGFCVTCSSMPCSYMVNRVLRHLLSRIQ